MLFEFDGSEFQYRVAVPVKGVLLYRAMMQSFQKNEPERVRFEVFGMLTKHFPIWY